MVGAGGWEVIVFLWLSAGAHLASPTLVERLLRQRIVVQAVGALLLLIGAACWAEARRLPKQVVALSVLGSGAARLLLPARMIAINEWTNRAVHGVLMLLGSVVCLVAFDFEHTTAHNVSINSE